MYTVVCPPPPPTPYTQVNKYSTNKKKEEILATREPSRCHWSGDSKPEGAWLVRGGKCQRAGSRGSFESVREGVPKWQLSKTLKDSKGKEAGQVSGGKAFPEEGRARTGP